MKGGETMAQSMKSRPRKKLKRPQFKEDNIPVELLSYEDFRKTLKPYIPKRKSDFKDVNLKLFSCDYEALDTIDAIPIIYHHLQDLELQGLDLTHFGFFVNLCYNKHTLEIYDHPGLPFCGGFYHMEGKFITAFYRAPAEYAFDWYRDVYLRGSDVKLKEVTKISCSPISEPIYYVTFTVVDVDGNEKTLQAQVLQFGIPRQFLMGMLRDASHDKVLAIIRFKEAPTEVVAHELETVLKKVGEKVLFKT